MQKPPLELLKNLKTAFSKRSESLALAESCTGGLISFWLTYLPGASQYFKGALVAYDAQAKTRLLNVPEAVIKTGVVSEKSAQEMARGVKNLFRSDWALATTGWAGPAGGTEKQPVGTVCFALCSKFAKASRLEYFKEKNRQDIQFEASLLALKFLLSHLHQ